MIEGEDIDRGELMSSKGLGLGPLLHLGGGVALVTWMLSLCKRIILAMRVVVGWFLLKYFEISALGPQCEAFLLCYVSYCTVRG